MAADLARTLSSARPFLSEAQVPEHRFSRLVDFAEGFPPGVLSALEVRLGSSESPVDLSVRLTRQEASSFLSLNRSDDKSSLHRPVSNWLKAGPEASPLHSLWFEFDADRPSGSDDPSSPVLCARIARPVDRRWILDVLWPIFERRSDTNESVSRIDKAAQVLPESCRLLYLFDLRARGQNAIRIEVYSESLADLIAWVKHLAHPSCALLKRFGELLGDCDRFHVSIESEASGWQPRIGLEASFRRVPSREPGWRRLFAALSQRGWIAPLWQDLHCSWPGSHPLTCEALDAESTEPRPWVARALSHVKISGTEWSSAEIKGYLLAQAMQRQTGVEVNGGPVETSAPKY